jgi:hypothetical protein
MNKKKLHHFLTILKKINLFILGGLIIFFGLVSVFSLRANNQKMIELRAAVFKTDEDNGDIEAALKALREHVYSHMNTNLSAGANAVKPPIQLKYRYERLVAAEQAKASAINSKVYTDAQTDCERRFPSGFSGSNRLPCITEYLDSHGVEVQSVPDALYKFDFVSPAWTPDLAGWSLVITALLLLIFILRILSSWLIASQLKKHA